MASRESVTTGGGGDARFGGQPAVGYFGDFRRSKCNHLGLGLYPVVFENGESPCCQGVPELHPVIEGQVDSLDLLPHLVSAPGHEDGVLRRRRAPRPSGWRRRAGRPPGPCSRGLRLSLAARAPASTSARMAAASSSWGSSSLTITMSASRAAMAPMAGRLPWSRCPVAPKTTITLEPGSGDRTASRARASASGLCAKSTTAAGAVGDELHPAGHRHGEGVRGVEGGLHGGRRLLRRRGP